MSSIKGINRTQAVEWVRWRGELTLLPLPLPANLYTVKKGLAISRSLAGMSLTKVSLAGNN